MSRVSIRRNIVANYVGQGVTAVLNVAFIPVYIDYVGIEAYGLLGLFAVMQVWLALLDVGMSPTLSREMARFEAGAIDRRQVGDLLHSVTLLSLAIGAVVVAGIALAAGWLASSWLNSRTLPLGTVRDALLIMAGVIGLRFVEGVQRSALIGLQQQVWLNGLTIVAATAKSGGALLVLAFVSPTIQAFMLWQFCIALLTLSAIMIKVRRALPRSDLRPRFSVAAVQEVRAFATGMFGVSILAILLTQVDKLLLSKLLPLDQFGYYILASNVAAMLYTATAPITQAVYPAFVHLAEVNDTAALGRRYHQSSQLVAVLLTPAALILMLFPHTALMAWSGDERLTTNTAWLLATLTVGCFINALMYIPHQLQIAHGWTGLSLKFNAVAVSLLIPAVLIAVPLYGAVAAAIIFAGLNVAYMLVQMPLMHRRLLRGELGRWYLLDIALPVGAALLVAGSARWLAGDAPTDRWSGTTLLVATGLIASIAAVLAADGVRRAFWRPFVQ